MVCMCARVHVHACTYAYLCRCACSRGYMRSLEVDICCLSSSVTSLFLIGSFPTDPEAPHFVYLPASPRGLLVFTSSALGWEACCCARPFDVGAVDLNPIPHAFSASTYEWVFFLFWVSQYMFWIVPVLMINKSRFNKERNSWKLHART